MNKISKWLLKARFLLSCAALFIVSVAANAAGIDFSGVTAAIDVTTVLAAISAVAALKVSPVFAKWAYSKLINWFGN
jgi:hypothetical protein